MRIIEVTEGVKIGDYIFPNNLKPGQFSYFGTDVSNGVEQIAKARDSFLRSLITKKFGGTGSPTDFMEMRIFPLPIEGEIVIFKGEAKGIIETTNFNGQTLRIQFIFTPFQHSEPSEEDGEPA